MAAIMLDYSDLNKEYQKYFNFTYEVWSFDYKTDKDTLISS